MARFYSGLLVTLFSSIFLSEMFHVIKGDLFSFLKKVVYKCSLHQSLITYIFLSIRLCDYVQDNIPELRYFTNLNLLVLTKSFALIFAAHTHVIFG